MTDEMRLTYLDALVILHVFNESRYNLTLSERRVVFRIMECFPTTRQTYLGLYECITS